MTTRIVMLAYAAEPELAEMTRQSLTRALDSTSEALATLFINGGSTFSVPFHERLVATYYPDRLSLGDAYNRVIAATNESAICLLHNDCIVPAKDWLGRLVAVAEKHGFAFPTVESDEAESVARGVTPAIPEMPPSCCYVISREAWNKLGGFDSRYEGCHFEDADLFMRAKMAGYRLMLVPEVKVYHRRGVTRSLTADESNAAFQRNKEIYTQRWQTADGTPLPQLEVPNG